MHRFHSLIVVFAAFTLSFAGCASKQQLRDDTQSPGTLSQLTAWMTGSFSSAAQAADDPENFRDIRLHMAPIWSGRSDGPWLYIEQSAATSMDKPYRQRIYRLSQTGVNEFRSEVFELPGDPLIYTGAWQHASLLDGVKPESLIAREGCSITLRFDEDAFIGSTRDQDCRSTLRGASYATSEVRITENELVSWDRGFNHEGQQVWGAEAGGYVFVRQPSAN